MEYYHNLVTEKSWEILKQLRRDYKFILIGGWAVFLWTKRLKSKDIDIVVDFPELEKLRQNFELSKNDRLKKYEVKREEIDLDIYANHYSNPGLPAEEIGEYSVEKDGFTVPRPEILLLLKQNAYEQRKGSPKGEKDKIDIFSLMVMLEFDWKFYVSILKEKKRNDLLGKIQEFLELTVEVPELNLDRHKLSRLKKLIFKNLYGN